MCLSVDLSGLHLASLSQVVADVHAKLRLQAMWQPGYDLWLVPKGSHMCVGVRVLQAHVASVCKAAPRLQAHELGCPGN